MIDITIPITSSTPVWPGDPKPTVRQVSSIEAGDESNVTQIRMSVHTGTHIDAPKHFFKQGITIDQIPLSKLVGDALVVQIVNEVNIITAEVLSSHPQIDAIRCAKKILFRTKNSLLWQKYPAQFITEYVGIDTSGAEFLATFDLDLIGIDYLSIAPFHDLNIPHQILLAKGVVLLEGIDLSQVSDGIYRLMCLPLKITAVEGAPVRAILI